jgi:hypothetical protein
MPPPTDPEQNRTVVFDADQRHAAAWPLKFMVAGSIPPEEEEKRMSETARQWPMFRQVWRRQELMDCMMQTTVVDVVAAVHTDRGQAFLDARSKCRLCPHEQECREWLATSRQGRWTPDFCPNARFFDAYRSEQD